MPHRARAIVGSLILTFAALATPASITHAQSLIVPAPTSMPAEQTDAKPFPSRIGVGGANVPSPTATSRPTREATPSLQSLGFDVGRMLAALTIVLALIGLAYWAAKRLIGRNATSPTSRTVKILSRTPLAPRQHVVLVQVGRRVIVVGDSGGQLASLAQIDDADEVAQLLGQIEGEQMRRATSFGGVFRRSQTSFDDAAADVPADVLATHDVPVQAGAFDEQRSELTGLLDKVRALRGQIDK